MEENNTDENDKQNEESSIRRSSRPRKAPPMEPTSVISPKTISQVRKSFKND